MGLASYFFTKDVDRAWRLLENLESGMIGMNTGSISAAESPFGGIKESGKKDTVRSGCWTDLEQRSRLRQGEWT